MKVCVFGLGYVGLPTAAVMSCNGMIVHGVDKDENIINALTNHTHRISEPELGTLIDDAFEHRSFTCSQSAEPADVFLIAVPTPISESKNADLSAIDEVLQNITPLLRKGALVILESTAPVGTTEKIASVLQRSRPELKFPSFRSDDKDLDINIAYCPERVLPGKIVKELISNDRIIGGISNNCALKAKKFYSTFVEGEIVVTDSRTAELCKLSENAYRDVNIAFANELSVICDKLGVDSWKVVELANHHPRVNILQPGPGVGGHCVAVDPWFIVQSAPNDSTLIRTSRIINDKRPDYVYSKIEEVILGIGKPVSEVNIACFGLSFKRDVDDIRGSPAVEIVGKILQAGVNDVMLVEPYLEKLPRGEQYKKARLVDYVEATTCADICVLLVDHEEFRKIDKSLLKNVQVIDTRGIWVTSQ